MLRVDHKSRMRLESVVRLLLLACICAHAVYKQGQIVNNIGNDWLDSCTQCTFRTQKSAKSLTLLRASCVACAVTDETLDMNVDVCLSVKL